MTQSRSDSQLQAIELSEQEVANCRTNLDASKASGLDGIPAHLLKECSNQSPQGFAVFLTCR